MSILSYFKDVEKGKDINISAFKNSFCRQYEARVFNKIFKKNSPLEKRPRYYILIIKDLSLYNKIKNDICLKNKIIRKKKEEQKQIIHKIKTIREAKYQTILVKNHYEQFNPYAVTLRDGYFCIPYECNKYLVVYEDNKDFYFVNINNVLIENIELIGIDDLDECDFSFLSKEQLSCSYVQNFLKKYVAIIYCDKNYNINDKWRK
jgi:hypothetical protein